MTMSASRVCILMLVASLRVAFGGIITLDAASRGWLQPVAPFNNGTSAGNNYLAGFCGPGDCVSNSSEFRDFFQFSIPSLSDTIVSRAGGGTAGYRVRGQDAGRQTQRERKPMTSARFQIQSIPALLVFKGGREVDRIVGAQPKSEILRRVERMLAGS